MCVCIKAEHIFHLHWPGCEFLRYAWGPEAGGTAHLQSQGEGEEANPHRPVPQGFEPWTFGSKVQYPTPEPPESLGASSKQCGNGSDSLTIPNKIMIDEIDRSLRSFSLCHIQVPEIM